MVCIAVVAMMLMTLFERGLEWSLMLRLSGYRQLLQQTLGQPGLFRAARSYFQPYAE
jgi:hypothetical protein